jgi:hypothetical protein
LYSLTALDGSIAISALARKIFFQFTRFCGKIDLSSAASSFLRIPASGFRDNSRNPSRLLNQGDAALLWARNIVLGRSDYIELKKVA